jgi:hypothetical protein
MHKCKLLKYVPNNHYLNFVTFKFNGTKELRKRAILGKIWREIFLAFNIFKIAKKNNTKLIVFASAFPFTSLFLNFFSRIFDQKIIICLHGDIGVLKIKRFKITTIIYKMIVKLFFRFRSLNVILLFFGKSIEVQLFKMLPNYEKRNIISIDHPYNYHADFEPEPKVIKNTIIIANIGTGLINKNSHLFFQLAKMQEINIKKEIVKFIQVGNVSPEVMSYSNGHVEIISNNEFIPFDNFEKNILKADYFIYFFTENSFYDLCPSGTFFDAIRYKKPIISLKNPFFDYYFNKLGNIGYLCRTIEDMNDIINKIVLGDTGFYNRQVEALNDATRLLSLDNIQKSFLFQYKELI